MSTRVSLLLFVLIMLPGHMSAQNPAESLFICKITLTEKCHKEGLPKDFLEVIDKHGKYLDELGKQGKLIFAGRTKIEPVTDKSNYGLVLFKASSLEHIRRLQDADPAVQAGVQQWEFFPFSMGIRYLHNLDILHPVSK